MKYGLLHMKECFHFLLPFVSVYYIDINHFFTFYCKYEKWLVPHSINGRWIPGKACIYEMFDVFKVFLHISSLERGINMAILDI